jgi:energy-coupling factor transporter ATP-binding protein EcfA2
VDQEVLFEQEVLRVARALWAKDSPYQGSVLLDGAERDGVFVGSDLVAVVEATVSKKLDKAKKDGDKLKAACEKLARQHPMKAVKGYFVTKEEPTAEQRQYIDKLKAGIVACSFAQLRSQLINSREYLTVRDRYPFGSARNPATGDPIDLGSYIPLGLLEPGTSASRRALNVSDIAGRIEKGEATVLLGDFGAGKSMTVREVHRLLRDRHLNDASKPFPVTLNLRDHQGQKDPDEALRRHAQTVGFDEGTKLVRAWRAGEVHLLLDGFDEIATSGWLGQAPNLRTVRQRSVELIRKFVDQSPKTVGLLVTGREHLFDSVREMTTSLGLSDRNPLVLRTDEFSDDQVASYLEHMGWTGSLPDWLPPRPLLLGYLAASGSIESVIGATGVSAPEGWDILLGRICDREAKIELGLDGGTVRRLLERLATLARSRGDGLGPLRPDDLRDTFAQICGYSPDEGSYVIIQRMPGLGVLDPVDGSRHFVDVALADAARAGDLVRLIEAGGELTEADLNLGSIAPIGELGLGVAELQATRAAMDATHATAAAVRLDRATSNDAFVLDCLMLTLRLGPRSKLPNVTVRDLTVPVLRIRDVEADIDGLRFESCLFGELDLTEYDGNHLLPIFSSCMFELVLGAGSPDALPPGHFLESTFEVFDASTKTTRGILAMPGLSDRQKVVLTVLKKVYLQAGGGRRENALVRGLDNGQRALVNGVLDDLVSAGLLVRGRAGNYTIFSSVRGQASRVRTLLGTGASSNDPILAR